MKAPDRRSLLAPNRRSLLAMPEGDRLAFLQTLDKDQKSALRWHWDVWARRDQLAPRGDWRCWLVLAGRGFGKTRAGAE